MHNYKYLEILFEMLYLEKEKRCLHEIYYDSIVILYSIYASSIE